jgi:c-di-GMP-binding flagellar brake protein YcgR
MGLSAAVNLENLIHVTETVERCTCSPCEGIAITCKFQIRRVYYDSIKQSTNIGCQFLEIDRDQQRVINRVVSDLQRQIRKRENRIE